MINRSGVDVTAFVHELAEVDEAHIGAHTRVWQFASVIRNARIGDDCSIASCAIVDGSRVGNRTLISHGAFIDPGLWIGDDVFIGPHVACANDIWPRSSKDGWFDIRDLIEGRIVVTRIEDGASVGANVVVLPGIRIGKRAMIAAGSVVRSDVPDDTLWLRSGAMVNIDPTRTVDRKRTCSA